MSIVSIRKHSSNSYSRQSPVLGAENFLKISVFASQRKEVLSSIKQSENNRASGLVLRRVCNTNCRTAKTPERRGRISLIVEGCRKSTELLIKELPKPCSSLQPLHKSSSSYDQPKKPVLLRRRMRKSIESVSIKEAIRDKEWLNKAKHQILRDLHSKLNMSNGISLCKEDFAVYKYYLEPGNNSGLIKQLMSQRPWWTQVGEDEKLTANFVWTQCRDKPVLETLPTLYNRTHQVNLIEVPSSIVCKTKLVVQKPGLLNSIYKTVDLSCFNYDLLTETKSNTTLECSEYHSLKVKLHNKLEGNSHLANKKGLFYSLTNYYKALGKNPFTVIPLTFHVSSAEDLMEFEEVFQAGSCWIVKPGEFSNRGEGICVCDSIEQIKEVLAKSKHTFVIQKYIERPLLVHRRKFDIRCFAMVTSYNGVLQGYFYKEGYIRTSSKAFTLGNLHNLFVHLTNDAVQKKSEDYGRHENGNKMSYSDFQRYVDNHTDLKVNFAEDIVPRMQKIVKDTIEAAFLKLDPYKRAHTFEVFGYDFLLDSNLKPWLLEINTNPCLELSSSHLARIIPAMLDNSFKIAVDPLFPNAAKRNGTIGEVISENKYELVFHSMIDGVQLIDELTRRGTLDMIKLPREEVGRMANLGDFYY